jgi:3-oxoacyl-[acyl-carrier protein] reductase
MSEGWKQLFILYSSFSIMDLGLNNRVAMVAAASKGIGKACALALAAEGCRLSICARGVEELQRARDEIALHSEAIAVTADVASPADLENWYRQTV